MREGWIMKRLVDMRGPDECWEWLGRVSPDTGYGKKQWMNKTELAHRWMWTMMNGPIPEGKVINHLCSNRKCVNPYHMEVVTQTENCRHGKGTKLAPEQVAEIKSANVGKKWGDGTKLAKKFGVSSALIHDIWNGRAWADEENAA